MLKISAGQLPIGAVFQYENDKLYKLLDREHVKPGKGPAYVKAKCVNLETGRVVSDMRMSTSEAVEVLYVEKLTLSYFYSESDLAYFGDAEGKSYTFRIDELGELGAIFLPSAKIDKMPDLEISRISYFSGKNQEEKVKIASVKLLENMIVTIRETRPFIKGQTAKANLKEALTAGGFKVDVPQYIDNGDQIYANYDEEFGFKFAGK